MPQTSARLSFMPPSRVKGNRADDKAIFILHQYKKALTQFRA